MSDDRFTYIHLRPEISLWSYVDEQVDWGIENLEDRVDQSAWDQIPPYQNEDDEGILPSHSHPSYPFGNPYDQNQVPPHAPQICPVINQPLAVGSALLLNDFNHKPGQTYWSELATEQLLERNNSFWPNLDELNPAELAGQQSEQQHHQANSSQQHHATTSAVQSVVPQVGMQTPVVEEYQAGTVNSDSDPGSYVMMAPTTE